MTAQICFNNNWVIYTFQISPAQWNRYEMAGEEWLKQFRGRHTDMKLKKPEACSLSKRTSFIKFNVGQFYNNLTKVFQQNPGLGDGTFNLDEKRSSTVQTPQKVLTDSAICL